jgi:hypothetical protein
MNFNSRNEKNRCIKFSALLIIVFCFLVPIVQLFIGFNDGIEDINDDKIPKAHTISKDNYQPILNEAKQSLGNITAYNITAEPTYGIGFNWITGYSSELDETLDDAVEGALNLTYKGMSFVETLNPAIVDNLNENITDRREISVKLNESISFQLNTSQQMSGGEYIEDFLVYCTILYPARLMELWVQENGSSIVQQVDEGNYSIYYDIQFVRFEYKNFFGVGDPFKNFTLYFIWEYNLSLVVWDLSQKADPDLNLLLTEQEQVITPEFNYQFILEGLQFNPENYTDPLQELQEINFFLNISLPNKEELDFKELKINGVVEPIGNHKGLNNSINVGDKFNANYSQFSLDFECNYTVRFEYSVGKTWAIDRLVSGRNVRERIYIPSLVSGPSNIYLKYATIFESTISIDQVISNISLFERNLVYYDANVSEYEAPTQYSLIFTENATKKKGLEIKIPYMIKGETCPFVFRYRTTKNLRIKITDNINMPLANFKLEIYYYGLLYGTYISNDKIQPMAQLITDGNGEVIIHNVPNGNYTLIVYQNNQKLVETSVSAYVEINYVATDIQHFPLLFIIFGVLSGSLVIIGLVIYKKNKR